MLFGFILGAAVAYFFHPQIDRGVKKVIRRLSDNRDDRDTNYY
jgi:hypothetical protein